jgi:hypothetical protein
MLPSQERARRTKSTSLLPYPKTSQDGNFHHHDRHPLLLYPYLQCLIRRPQRESGRGRKVGGRHHTYPASSHHSQSSGHPSIPSPFLSLSPASHRPRPRSSFLPKSSQRRPSREYRRLPTRPIIRPSSHTHFPTSHRLPSGTYLRP